MNIWMGEEGTKSPLHNDPYENVFAQVVEWKYFGLYHPKETDKLYPRGIEGGIEMGNTSEVISHPLALLFLYLCCGSDAEHLERCSAEIFILRLGDENSDTLTSMSNLASTYRNQGRLQEASDLEERALEARKRVLGEEHPDTLTSMSDLALVYQNQGRLQDALDLEGRTLEARRRVLGKEH